ncbi:hypothetical protein [Mesonia sp. HuA40]|uniref:hypothetical protein n=1 Tax=Mesonia sp. HuA40 TaxID=2602761 RepID=UPI0011C9449B|nr:hypothetical protein [Mesonia sp. HuA40]TXK74589.1 hypothetical protein FT993_01730 [Mesonia sp. HuA40]
MQFLKNALALYIRASLHVGLAVSALSHLFSQHFQQTAAPSFYLFVFFATVVSYNFAKFSAFQHLRSLGFHLTKKSVLLVQFVAVIGLVITCLQLAISQILFAGILGLFTLLYAIPLGTNKQNWRNSAYLKIFIIAGVWACTVVVLPLIPIINMELRRLMAYTALVFVFTLASTLVFEIRDLNKDDVHLKTIPQLYGVMNTKILGVFLYLFVILGIGFLNEFNTAFWYASILTSVMGILFLAFADIKQPKHYADFWVESLPIFWWLLYQLGQWYY